MKQIKFLFVFRLYLGAFFLFYSINLFCPSVWFLRHPLLWVDEKASESAREKLLDLLKDDFLKKDISVFAEQMGETAFKSFSSGVVMAMFDSWEKIEEYVRTVGLREPERERFLALRQFVMASFTSFYRDSFAEIINELLGLCVDINESLASLVTNDVYSNIKRVLRAEQREDFPEKNENISFRNLFFFTSFKKHVDHYFFKKSARKCEVVIQRILSFFTETHRLHLQKDGDFCLARAFLNQEIFKFVFDVEPGSDQDILMRNLVSKIKLLAGQLFVVKKIEQNSEWEKVYAFYVSSKTKNWVNGLITGAYEMTPVDGVFKYCGEKMRLLENNRPEEVLIKAPSLQIIALASVLTVAIGLPVFAVKRIGSYLYNRNKELFFPPEGLRVQTVDEEKMSFKNYKFDKNNFQKFSDHVLSFRKKNRALTPLLLTGCHRENWSLIHAFANENYFNVYSLDLGELSEFEQMFVKITEIISFAKRNKVVLFIKGCPLKNTEKLFVKIKRLFSEFPDTYSGIFVFSFDGGACQGLFEKIMGESIERFDFAKLLTELPVHVDEKTVRVKPKKKMGFQNSLTSEIKKKL